MDSRLILEWILEWILDRLDYRNSFSKQTIYQATRSKPQRATPEGEKTKTVCGTSEYMAPEIIKKASRRRGGMGCFWFCRRGLGAVNVFFR